MRDDPRNQFYHLYNKASVLFLENDVVSALYYFDRARSHAEENGIGADIVGSALMASGDILYKSRRYDEAIEVYLRGLEQIRKGGEQGAGDIRQPLALCGLQAEGRLGNGGKIP